MKGWPERFWAKVETASGSCWLWTGARNDQGYGVTWVPDIGVRYAHRIAYELLIGPISADLTIDHIAANGCANRNCVRVVGDAYEPAHLELVTLRENLRRARPTHCIHGHPFDIANTYVRRDGHGRHCRECKRLRDRIYIRLKREGVRP